MKTKLLLLVSGLLVAVSTLASTATVFSNDSKNSTIIELYTSQGCSSCPPAESWLGKFKDDPRLWKTLFPLAFHVDYWDYIGWKDIYAQPAFTQRQKNYKKENRLSSIYTPGFVINGKEWRGWFSRKSLPAKETSGKLTARLNDRSLTANYLAEGLQAYELTLNAAIVATGIKTAVKRGENSGRMLPQDFTVLMYASEHSTTSQWKMILPEVSGDDAERLALVVWISATDSQQPLQIAGGWL
ncbi:MAG: DUF1223 domain-containing protein [Gammaproteobacteria bacterium]|nr:DUF1223 domain-containing protein [Gammaproteobacteria bacterium]